MYKNFMYKNTVGCNGCLLFLVIAFIFTFLFKFWLFLLIILAIVLYVKEVGKIFIKPAKKQTEYTSKPGKIYKQCNFCNTKADRNVTICPKCGQSFEG